MMQRVINIPSNLPQEPWLEGDLAGKSELAVRKALLKLICESENSEVKKFIDESNLKIRLSKQEQMLVYLERMIIADISAFLQQSHSDVDYLSYMAFLKRIEKNILTVLAVNNRTYNHITIAYAQGIKICETATNLIPFKENIFSAFHSHQFILVAVADGFFLPRKYIKQGPNSQSDYCALLKGMRKLILLGTAITAKEKWDTAPVLPKSKTQKKSEIEILSRAKHKPCVISIYLNYAAYLFDSGNEQKAISMLERAVNPPREHAWYNELQKLFDEKNLVKLNEELNGMRERLHLSSVKEMVTGYDGAKNPGHVDAEQNNHIAQAEKVVPVFSAVEHSGSESDVEGADEESFFKQEGAIPPQELKNVKQNYAVAKLDNDLDQILMVIQLQLQEAGRLGKSYRLEDIYQLIKNNLNPSLHNDGEYFNKILLYVSRNFTKTPAEKDFISALLTCWSADGCFVDGKENEEFDVALNKLIKIGAGLLVKPITLNQDEIDFIVKYKKQFVEFYIAYAKVMVAENPPSEAARVRARTMLERALKPDCNGNYYCQIFYRIFHQPSILAGFKPDYEKGRLAMLDNAYVALGGQSFKTGKTQAGFFGRLFGGSERDGVECQHPTSRQVM